MYGRPSLNAHPGTQLHAIELGRRQEEFELREDWNGVAMRPYPLTMAQNDRLYASNTSRARPPPLLIHASTQRK
jgi:hypothetical protein